MQYQKRLAGLAFLFIIGMLTLFSVTQAQQEAPLPLPLDPSNNGQNRATVELLTNISFETDADANGIPDGWASDQTAPEGHDKRKCDKNGKVFAHTGSCAFMFKSNPDGTRSKLVQKLADTSEIVNGSVLTFTAFIDPRSGEPESEIGVVKVKLSDGSELKLRLLLPSDPTVTGYQQVTNTETAVIPAGVTILKAKADFRDKATGKYLVDDVSLSVTTMDSTNTPVPTNTLVAPTSTVAGPTNTPTEMPTATSTNTPVPSDKLVAADGAADDQFGRSVSVSADGNTVLVGMPLNDEGSNTNQGSAYVYVRSGGIWTQQEKLVAANGASSDNFGYSVSVSADGNTALVGANYDDVGSSINQGSVYVYVRSGTTWTQQQQLVAADGASNDNFGYSVSVSADGNTALVGANYDDVGSLLNQGSVYVFTRSGTTWTPQQKLVAADGAANDEFGYSVSVSADGNTALVGANFANIEANSNQGSAYVFTRSGTTWTSQQKLVAADGATNDEFGFSVSVSGDGNTALVAVPYDDKNVTNQGSVYVFTRSGTAWTQQTELTATDGAANDQLGSSVSVSADGYTALVGANGDNSAQGSAYVFTRSGTTWTQQLHLLAADGMAGDLFGSSVSMSAYGNVALIGAFQDDVVLNSNQGSAYVFTLNQCGRSSDVEPRC